MKAPDLLTYDKSKVKDISVVDAIVQKDTEQTTIVNEKGIRMLLEDGRKLWLPLAD